MARIDVVGLGPGPARYLTLETRDLLLAGDPVYLRRTPASARLLPAETRDALLAFPRQALHAATLGFRHPVSGQALSFESPLPADFAALLALLDGNSP